MAIRTADGVTTWWRVEPAPSSILFWTDTLRCVEYIFNGNSHEAVQFYDSKKLSCKGMVSL